MKEYELIKNFNVDVLKKEIIRGKKLQFCIPVLILLNRVNSGLIET